MLINDQRDGDGVRGGAGVSGYGYGVVAGLRAVNSRRTIAAAAAALGLEDQEQDYPGEGNGDGQTLATASHGKDNQ